MSYNNSYGNYTGTYLNQCLPNISGHIVDVYDGIMNGQTVEHFINVQGVLLVVQIDIIMQVQLVYIWRQVVIMYL